METFIKNDVLVKHVDYNRNFFAALTIIFLQEGNVVLERAAL